MAFFSSKLADMKDQMEQQVANSCKVIKDQDELIAMLKAELDGMLANLEGSKKGKFISDVSLMMKAAASRHSSEKETLMLTKEHDELMKQNETQQMQNEALALKVAEYEAEIERLKNLLVDQKDLTHKKEMESLVLEQKLRDRDSDCRARDSLIDEKKKVQDGLQNQLLQAQSQERLQLMPWAVHRPVVETCWASEIVHGSWALNLPPNTEVELPAKLAYSGYPVDVPGGSEAILPEGKELRVAFPPYSVLTFAKDVFFEEITVPSGTTIITDAKAAGPLHMTVPPGTRIIPPGNDLDHKLRLLEPSSEPDSAEASAASADDEIYFAPAGVPSAITAPAGSMLEMPMGVRSQLRVPSGCQYIFQMGQKRHLTVPGQSHIRLRDGGDGVLLLPPETCIRLPPADADHRSWNVFLPSDSIATVPKTPATSASLVNITVPNRTRIDGPEEGAHSFLLVLQGTHLHIAL
ncbi:hypothetical protein CYMTET_36629 [Cymbomonas tetramitiformis]|uniref:Uncharacterized protein n=1 Tax=Cymbomonas tetramitiformis TaxID=36881 RepID=A0AAE0CHB7_9CHLO|nr:hypothetical protein CYMTET_36629 [Cymbomonas tetramitiformis]